MARKGELAQADGAYLRLKRELEDLEFVLVELGVDKPSVQVPQCS